MGKAYPTEYNKPKKMHFLRSRACVYKKKVVSLQAD